MVIQVHRGYLRRHGGLPGPRRVSFSNEAATDPERYEAFNLHNYRELPQIQRLSEEQRFEIEVVAQVLPFKTNRYVVEQLIDWEAGPDDPMFTLNFPHRGMLREEDFETIASLLRRGASREEMAVAVHEIRLALNPHPAGQLEHNVPMLGDKRLPGLQHKYGETVLFFPSAGQTCHAYCTFCFRWPQFVGMDGLTFAMKETDDLIAYLREHTEVTDVLFTGGDPLVMRTERLARYIRPLIEARLPHIRTVRIGSKALSYWPHRFTTDDDAAALLSLFREVTSAGLHLSVMAHVNHPREISTPAAREAIDRVRATGAEIRTQSPLMRHINDDPGIWAEMWERQVQLGCVPYYMFIARDTGAQEYFSVPLVRALEIFRQAHNSVSGLARTVRGPSMSCDPGKVQVTGIAEVAGEKVIALKLLQGRNPDWALRPFFAQYDENAVWLSDLKPAFGEERFFFEEELEQMYRADAARAASGAR